MQTYKKSPSANAHAFADGEFRYIAPACCRIYGGCHEESLGVLPRGSLFLLFSFSFLCFTEVLLGIVVVGFKKSILYKRAYKVHLGPLRPSLEESLCPKSCSSTRAAPRPWEQLLGSAPEETGNVC